MPVSAVGAQVAPWWVLELVGVLLVMLAGTLAIAASRSWPRLGRRYERDGAPPERGSGPAAPASAGSTWEQLDAGVDPTLDPPRTEDSPPRGPEPPHLTRARHGAWHNDRRTHPPRGTAMTADAHATSDAHATAEHEDHGNTPAAWTAVAIIIVAFIIGAVAVLMGNWLLFWLGGIGLCIVGAVVGKVMSMMGMGKQPEA